MRGWWENHIKTLKHAGLNKLPYWDFAANQAWALLAARLVTALRRATVDKIAIATVNGDPVQEHPAAAALLGAGFYSTPQGIRFRR